MKQKIITANKVSSLNTKIEDYIKEGWVPVGGHTVVTVNIEVIHAGQRRIYDNQYSQTMKKEEE